MDLCQRCVSCCVVRLWSLQTFTALVCFKGHNYPVWSVEFRWVEEMIKTCGGFVTIQLVTVSLSHTLSLLVFLLQSPLGFYFVTGSHDKTARVWSTDHIQPLRILAGHLSDVDVRSWQKLAFFSWCSILVFLLLYQITVWSREKCCTFCVLCMKIYWLLNTHMLCESANRALPSTWSLCFTSWYQLEEQLLPILYYAYYYWVDAYYLCVVLQVPSKW